MEPKDMFNISRGLGPLFSLKFMAFFSFNKRIDSELQNLKALTSGDSERQSLPNSYE